MISNFEYGKLKRKRSEISSQLALNGVQATKLIKEQAEVGEELSHKRKFVKITNPKPSSQDHQLNLFTFFSKKPKSEDTENPSLGQDNPNRLNTGAVGATAEPVNGEPTDEEERKNDDHEKQSANKPLRISWSEKVKAEALEMMKTLNVVQVYDAFKQRVPISNIYRWKKAATSKRKVGSGRKPISEEVDNLLFEWFLVARARKLDIDDEILRNKALKFAGSLTRPMSDFKCSNGFLWRFKKRFNIVKRCISTFSKKKVSIMKPLFESYFSMLDRKISQQTEVWNFDEVPIFFEMYKKTTLDLKSSKAVAVVSSGKDKCRVTVLLAISSLGRKLPLVIILKNDAKGDIPKRLTKTLSDILKEKKVILLQNKKGWNKSKLMVQYIIPKLLSQIKLQSQEHLIIADNCTAHSHSDVIEAFQDHNLNLNFLPPESTSLLQPVDISIGKSFKTRVKDYFRTWLESNYEEITKFGGRRKVTFGSPSRENLITWAVDAWDSIEESMIIKSKNSFSSPLTIVL